MAVDNVVNNITETLTGELVTNFYSLVSCDLEKATLVFEMVVEDLGSVIYPENNGTINIRPVKNRLVKIQSTRDDANFQNFLRDATDASMNNNGISESTDISFALDITKLTNSSVEGFLTGYSLQTLEE